MDKILQKFGIDETYTKPVKKPKYFTKFKTTVPDEADWNDMIDVLFLPKTKKGNQYLVVCTDLATHEFDIEPIKDKEAQTVLTALLKMYKRPYIKKPKYSIATDGGSEFKAEFAEWTRKQDIYEKTMLPDRHTQQSPVERLNRELARIFNGYMNVKEEETGEEYCEWDTIVNDVRVELNKLLKRKPLGITALTEDDPRYFPKLKPKFKKGDAVY